MTNDDLLDFLKQGYGYLEKEEPSKGNPFVVGAFQEIQDFVARQGRIPVDRESSDIFERIFAVRLARIRKNPELVEMAKPYDRFGILENSSDADSQFDSNDKEELLSLLSAGYTDNDLTELRFVRSAKDIRSAEEVANRYPCHDFANFKPKFDDLRMDLRSGKRRLTPFAGDASINEGNFFVLGGQSLYVSEIGELFFNQNDEEDARLRVIFDNKTESNLLRSSLVRAMYKDPVSRRVSEIVRDNLFGDELEDGDIESGTIYVLRSNSDDSYFKENRDLIHKIGVTGGKVEHRIANAKSQSTYLFADVEVVASYSLANVNRTRLEQLIHKILNPARLEITVALPNGRPFKPREWFLVPLAVIHEVIDHIRSGDVVDFEYDVDSASLVARS